MKVQYTEIYTDDFGDTYEPGWVAEHTDSEGALRVSLGVCKEVHPDTKAFKYKPEAKLIIDECSDIAPEQPLPFQKSGPLVVASKSQK